MAQFPCLPLWTDALKADTDHLSDTEFGRYIRILILMWRTPGCRIPANPAWLCKHLHLPLASAAELETLIVEFCQNDGNWITQKRLKREFIHTFERHGRLSDLAKRREKKKKGINSSRSAADAQREPLHYPEPEHPRKKDLDLACGESGTSGAEKQEGTDQQTPRSLATALPSGALAHSASDEQAEEKKKPSNGRLEASPELQALVVGKRWGE